MSKHLSSRVIAAGKWLQLEAVNYKDEAGKERVWEMCSRTTTRGSSAECVAIFAKLKTKNKEDQFVFVRQYRPCLKTYTLEFPAGLVDTGETLESAALRELKEETGYVGRIMKVGPPVALDSGLSSSLVSLVFVDIDGEENINARKEVQEGEYTEVITVPVSKVGDKIKEVIDNGDIVDSRVYAYTCAFNSQ